MRGQERMSVGEGGRVGPAPVARATICIVVLSPRGRTHTVSVQSRTALPNGSHFHVDSRPLPQMLHRDSETALLLAKTRICPPHSITNETLIASYDSPLMPKMDLYQIHISFNRCTYPSCDLIQPECIETRARPSS